MDATTITPTVTPAPPMSLRAHIDVEDAALDTTRETQAPAAVAAPAASAAPAETPEQEAASAKADVDLSEAGRALRQNRISERTKKLADENKALREELRVRKMLRQELEGLAPERSPVPPQQPPLSARRPAMEASGADDTTDPEPQDTEFQDYSAFVTAKAAWAARREFARQQTEHRARIARERTSQDLAARASKLDDVADAMREKYADFDAVTETFVHTLHGNPRGLDVAAFLAESEVGGEIAYRVAKDPAVTKALATAPNKVALVRELARVEHAITSAAAAGTTVTSAPKPPEQTVGASASPETDTRKGVSFKEHRRIEDAREAEARRQGRRY